MERVYPWLAALFAAVIAIVGVIKVADRRDAGELAVPTSVPSPTAPTTMGPLTPTTDAPPTTAIPAATAAPTATVAPTEAPASPTIEPPASTTPPPVGAEPMPHTGGGAVGPGLALVALAATLGAAVRRSY